MTTIVTVFLLCAIFRCAVGYSVALFPSTGCYSHDVMMKQIGEEFPNDNITWIQTYLYEFGFGEMSLHQNWTRLSISGVDEEGQTLMKEAGSLIWEQNVPTDFERPWDIRGTVHFVNFKGIHCYSRNAHCEKQTNYRMLERHQRFCEVMMNDARFRNLAKDGSDVVILDHFLLECLGGLSGLLNASTVQFSNWPIADGYITSLNVPANPSVVPKTGTPFTGTGMSFAQRTYNSLFHGMIVLTRIIQIHILDSLFARNGFNNLGVISSEAQRTIYAGRSEFLFDVIRPINNRIKHFGGANCKNPQDYIISLPRKAAAEIVDERDSESSEETDLLETIPYGLGNISSLRVLDTLPNCTHCRYNSAKTAAGKSAAEPSELTISEYKDASREWLYRGVAVDVVERRFLDVQQKFPSIDWKRLEEEKFVLVSFGSVAQVENMDLDLLRHLLKAFASSKNRILWQTNSKMEQILTANEITLPANLEILNWVPIKELLTHPNLQYVICHGGINTVNELLLFGVPIIGVPLQGDQSSNIRRLADLGVAEMTSTVGLRHDSMYKAIRKMEYNLAPYWRRASEVSQMLRSYRELHQNDQNFWLHWTARNGPKLRNRQIFRLNYIGAEENWFWASLVLGFAVVVLILGY